MTKDSVIYIRDTLKKNSDCLIVTLDNTQIFSDKVDYLIWDDDNERIYCIRANVDQYSQAHCPVEIISSTYEFIQFIVASYSSKNIKAAIDEFSDLIPAEDKDKVVKYFMNLQNQALEQI